MYATPKINVINLKRDVDKWANFIQQIDGGTSILEFKRFEAIDGKKGNSNVKVNPICSSILCNPGVIGCAQSHITLWQNMINNNESFSIIMEDDAKFDMQELENVITCIIRYLQDTGDDSIIISLKCVGPFCNIGEQFYIKNYKATKSIFPLATTAYIITNSAARYLLNKMQNSVNYHIDFEIAKLINDNNKLKYYVIPDIVTCNTLETSIGSTHKKSLFFGWSKELIWYCNIPIWKYGNLYTALLLLLIFILFVIGFSLRKKIYIFISCLLIIELYIFKSS